MATETKADRDTRHKHHQTLGGVTHGVHHGVSHGEHGVTASRNVHNNGKVKPDPHAGGAKGWVYTTKKGDTIASLTKKAWSGSNWTGGKGNPNLYTYANNSKILQGQKGVYNRKTGISIYGAIKPGTKVVL